MKIHEHKVAVVSLKAKRTRQEAHQRLRSVANNLEKSLNEIECLLEQFNETHSDEERAIFVNRAINHLMNKTMLNFRIDLLADSQVELTMLAAKNA